MVPLRTLRPRNHLAMLPVLMQTVRTYADTVVKVPQMAESISEGTLKQFSKGVGDFVEQDEEIATIETDKVRVRAPVPSWLCLNQCQSVDTIPRLMLPSMPQKLAPSRSC